jgi:ABC-type branched-subunit amino acid transport system substrate-binding protein
VALLALGACGKSSGGSDAASSGSSSAPAGSGSSTSSGSDLKYPFATTIVQYGSGGDPEQPVNPPAPSGGNGGATDTGVTATTINLGQMVSNTGLAMGIFDGMLKSTKSYVDMVNAGGGVYGRKLQLTTQDDGFDQTKDTALCEPLVDKSFAMVASMALADAGCYDKLKSSNIPDVSPVAWDPRIPQLPNVFIPAPNTYSNLIPAIQKALHPDIKKVWLCETNGPGIAAQAAPEKKAWESVGVQVLDQGALPGNAADYTAAVVKAKNAGADAVDCFSTSVTVTAALAKAISQQGWKPKVMQGYSVYTSDFLKLAGSAADGWSYGIGVPFMDQQAVLSTQAGKDYQKSVGETPQTINDTFGWEYMDLVVQALVKAGPNLTRASFADALKGFHNFTANGLMPPWDPGAKGQMSTCFAMEGVQDGKFVQTAPDAGKLVCGGSLFS